MDATTEYMEILRWAAFYSVQAQQEDNPDYLAGTARHEMLCRKAYELGQQLQALLPALGASGCSVAVSAVPPNIELSVSWDRPTS